MGESDVREIVDIPNKVRGFMVYQNLYDILDEYIQWGDGYHSLPVYDESIFADADAMDVSIINLMKLLSTAFGLTHVNEAVTIVNAIHSEGVGKTAVRFRSRHPLFVGGTPLYQNVCLVSGMIHMNIPILPYFDGEKLLINPMEDFHVDIDEIRVKGERRG